MQSLWLKMEIESAGSSTWPLNDFYSHTILKMCASIAADQSSPSEFHNIIPPKPVDWSLFMEIFASPNSNNLDDCSVEVLRYP